MIEPPLRLLLGLLTGIAFGFLLQKGRVAKYDVIVRQLLLVEFTVAKIMVSAVAVGAVGFWMLVGAGQLAVDVKPVQPGGVLGGAVLFGVGLAILGYCPGTTVAAVGEGHRDALAGFGGMLAGALAFVAAFPIFDRLQKAWADFGEVTLPAVTRTSPALWIAVLGMLALGFYWFSRPYRPAVHHRH
jgi:hypothetical protein